MCPPAMILTLEGKQFWLHEVVWKFNNVEYEVPKFTYSCIGGHKWTVCTRCSCCRGELWEGNLLLWFYPVKLTPYIFYRVLSGAFDKVVKVWSQDGQVMHKFDGFRFVAFTRYSCHLLGIIYSKMMTSLLFFYMVIGPQWLNSS